MIDDQELWDLHPDPVEAWAAILTMIEKAETADDYARIAAVPLNHFWTDHEKAYLPAAATVAARLPQLANMLIAEGRHVSYAAHVMNLINGIREPFQYEPRAELAALVTPGAHPLTEGLRIPNVQRGARWRTDAPPPTEEEQRKIIAGYVADPDEWWEDLDEVVRDHPRIAFAMVLAICADPAADLGRVGAGPLEDLVSNAEDVLRDDVLAALDNERFMQAFSSAYLFSLSDDFLDALAARLTSAPLRPTFTR